MKRSNIKILIIIALIYGLTTPFLLNPTNVGAQEEKPTFKFGAWYYGFFQNFDPVVEQVGSVAPMFMSYVVETLFTYNYYTGGWDNQLAVGFEQVNGTHQIVHLREDVIFHDGSPFNADAVKWNYDRIIELTAEPTQQWHSLYWRNTDRLRPYKDDNWDIDWIPEGDDYPAINETIVLNETAVMFRYNIPYYGRHNWPILSPTAYAAYRHEPWFGVDSYVGTGWLKYNGYELFDGIIRLEGNDNYWGGEPWIDSAICLFFDNSDTAQTALVTGAIDYIIDPADPDFFNDSVEFDLIWHEPPYGITGETLTLEMPVHNTATYLRKAISYSFNYPAYIYIEQEGKAVRAGGAVPTNNMYYNDSIPLPYYDLAIARQIMIDEYPTETTAAGLTNETTLTMDQMWINRADTDPFDVFGFWYEPSSAWCAPFIEEASKSIGVEPNITPKSQETMGEYYPDKAKRAEIPSYLIYPTYDMGPSPLSWLTLLYDATQTWNPSYVNDQDLNNWTWYFYVLNDTSDPTVQDVVNWIVTKVQTEIYPSLWIAQYPRYAAKSAHWKGDPGYLLTDFSNFVYDPVSDFFIPSAQFTANLTEIYAGQWIEFTDVSSYGDKPLNFQWSFGDGTANSTERNPVHQYNSIGNYTVILTVTDADGDLDVMIKINYIQVQDNQDPDPDPDPKPDPDPDPNPDSDNSENVLDYILGWSLGIGSLGIVIGIIIFIFKKRGSKFTGDEPLFLN